MGSVLVGRLHFRGEPQSLSDAQASPRFAPPGEPPPPEETVVLVVPEDVCIPEEEDDDADPPEPCVVLGLPLELQAQRPPIPSKEPRKTTCVRRSFIPVPPWGRWRPVPLADVIRVSVVKLRRAKDAPVTPFSRCSSPAESTAAPGVPGSEAVNRRAPSVRTATWDAAVGSPS
jgi:hypothetical protein